MEEKKRGKYAYQESWKKENTVQIGIRFQKSSDADLIQWLENKPSKAGEIKRLMRIAIESEEIGH